MTGIAARIDPASRQRMLREMGIEVMRPKPRSDAAGTVRCLILVPVTARGDEGGERLLQRIMAAAGLPPGQCTLRWLQPGADATGLPERCCCLVFGPGLAEFVDESAWQLPSLDELLREPVRKRQVWDALVEAQRRLMAEA